MQCGDAFQANKCMCMSDSAVGAGAGESTGVKCATNEPLQRRAPPAARQSHSIARDSKTDFITLTMGKKVQ